METLPSSVHSTSRTIRYHEEVFLGALRMQDHDGVAEMLDSKFRAVGIFGTVYDKKEYLHQAIVRTEFRSIQLRHINVIEETGFAFSISEVEADVTLNSAVIKGLFRVTRAWVQRAASWKMLSLHITDSRLGESWDKTNQVSNR
ncbi:MAG: nuclear transport factor 2 family protein [Proteobacteria bacterium]|nr:MAG: nuclear transport factor 2 family protein [Pseudomonadota bacterium]